MKMSTLVGAKAGAAIFRDNRCWHGATPNLSKEIRALPNVEYTPAWRVAGWGEEIIAQLTAHGQRIGAKIVARPGVEVTGAGIMHPAQQADVSHAFYMCGVARA